MGENTRPTVTITRKSWPKVRFALTVVAVLVVGCSALGLPPLQLRPVQLPNQNVLNRSCASARAAFPSTLRLTTGQCGLNRKTLLAPVRICGYGAGASRCTNMVVKVGFLGDKIIFYDSVNEETGIVFELGKELDLTSDSRQGAQWRGLDAKKPAGTSVTATASASLNGDCLQLTLENRVTNSASGRLYSLFNNTMAFRLPACSNSCQVLDYFIYMDNSLTTEHSEQGLANQSCRLQ